jgi:NAD(P)-dependent dehydrogenase (short-subunit alcohol dehydrogenase family)
MAINAKGVFWVPNTPSQPCGGPGGSISNISSGGAVRLFTTATAVQHAKDNIHCNSVHPGPIDTPVRRSGEPSDAARVQKRVSRIPLGRMGTPEDVAYGVLYLASDESAFVTGSELVIDGGRTAQ